MSKKQTIEDFPDYLIYDDGRVFSVRREIFLKGGLDKDGYKLVTLCAIGSQTTKKVNRLVAEAFIPNPNNHPVVHHKDHVKLHNDYTNLEWCTVSHNTKEAYKAGKLTQRGEKNNACKYSDKFVNEVKSMHEQLRSITEVANVMGIKYGTAYSFIKGLRRS